jgi:hypothetical protein
MEEYQRRSRMGLISPKRNQKLDGGPSSGTSKDEKDGPTARNLGCQIVSPNGLLANGIPLLLRNQNRTTWSCFSFSGFCAGGDFSFFFPEANRASLPERVQLVRRMYLIASKKPEMFSSDSPD